MILSKRVALGAAQLDQVDLSIVIRSIDVGTTKETFNTTARMGGVGQRITNKHWDALEVSVSFAIDIHKEQMDDRKDVFDDVVAWALAKGWLTVNWMPGKRMFVDQVVLPKAGDMREWTNDYTIIFRAYAVPFWQDDTATEATGSTITVPGNTETVCNAEITNSSGSTINTLSVAVGDSTLNFTNLGLANGETLIIDHGTDGILQILIANTSEIYRSALGKRTGGSDDLFVSPGVNDITITGGTVTKVIRCYGRYVA